MRISFYHVDGISKEDTIYFSNAIYQERYFDEHRTQFIEDAFYPPYCNIEYKLDTDIVNFTSNINYISLQFNGKEYYYFIDDIIYVNEGLMKLKLSMDTIQTFMFDIENINGILERKSIKRWNIVLGQDKINRSYIRENFSDSDFILETSRDLNIFPTPSTVVGCNVIFTNIDHLKTKIIKDDKEIVELQTALAYHFYTADGDIEKVQIGNGPLHDYSMGEYQTDPTVFKVINVPDIAQIGFYDYSVYTAEVEENGNIVRYKTLKIGYYHLNIPEFKTVQTHPTLAGSEIMITTRYRFPSSTKREEFSFIKNINIGVPRDYKYVPYVFDNNYMTVLYGEKYNLNEVNLFLYEQPKFQFNFTFDINTGHRKFWTSIVDTTDDIFCNAVSYDSSRMVDISTDPWKEFEASNQATLNEGIILQNTLSLIKGALLSTTFQSPMPMVAGMSSAINRSISLDIESNNKKLQPITPNLVSTLTSALASDANKQKFLVYKKTDIESAANIVENTGYKVNEVINTNDIFNNCYIRHYYNVIKMKSCDITLSCLQSQKIIEDLKTRFINGIRLWDIENGHIGDYQYDNVEEDFIV